MFLFRLCEALWQNQADLGRGQNSLLAYIIIAYVIRFPMPLVSCQIRHSGLMIWILILYFTFMLMSEIQIYEKKMKQTKKK